MYNICWKVNVRVQNHASLVNWFVQVCVCVCACMVLRPTGDLFMVYPTFFQLG